ncbi:hypothetical protein ACLOJK_005165 [Asimina triloba]
MASAVLPAPLGLLGPAKPAKLPLSRGAPKLGIPLSSPRFSRQLTAAFPRPFRRRLSNLRITRAAYISAPASEPNVGGVEKDRRAEESDSETVVASSTIIDWDLVSSLLLRHKLRLAVALASMVGCTAWARSEPLWRLLTKVGLLYAMEPVFTVIFVINLSSTWEKVMSTIRAQVFRRIMIQKVEFFDRYKVGELTGLLTSDLGSLKDIVSENISRDRGLRAISEASYYKLCKSELSVAFASTSSNLYLLKGLHVVGTIFILFALSAQLAPVLGLLMLSVSLLVMKISSSSANDIKPRKDCDRKRFK